jgi:UDP-N-acetylglucosamine 2-epimerase (non-hydrolysing)
MAFLSLWARSTLVIKNSGGLQEETTALGTPCITARKNTEPNFVGLDVHKETTVIARAPTERRRVVSAPWSVMRNQGDIMQFARSTWRC